MTDLPIAEGVEFRPIPGYPGYVASSKGEIWKRAYRKAGDGHWYRVSSHMSHGYKQVTLHCNGKKCNRKVHLLIALAFIGERPEGLQVRHLNDKRLDNAATNIAYGTLEEQAEDKRRNNPLSKFTARSVKLTYLHGLLERRLRALGCSVNMVSKLFGVDQKTARRQRRDQHTSSKAKELPIDTLTLARVFVDKYQPAGKIPQHKTVDGLLEHLARVAG